MGCPGREVHFLPQSQLLPAFLTVCNAVPKGFSGLPTGPLQYKVSPLSRKKRIVEGGVANYGEWPWQIFMERKTLGMIFFK